MVFDFLSGSLCLVLYLWLQGFPGGSDSKESAFNVEDPALIPEFQEDPLEKGVVTHSSVFAWRIPWTEEPGGLQSMGSQRVGYNWVTNTSHFTSSRSFQNKSFEKIDFSRSMQEIIKRNPLDQEGE